MLLCALHVSKYSCKLKPVAQGLPLCCGGSACRVDSSYEQSRTSGGHVFVNLHSQARGKWRLGRRCTWLLHALHALPVHFAGANAHHPLPFHCQACRFRCRVPSCRTTAMASCTRAALAQQHPPVPPAGTPMPAQPCSGTPGWTAQRSARMRQHLSCRATMRALSSRRVHRARPMMTSSSAALNKQDVGAYRSERCHGGRGNRWERSSILARH